MATALPGSIEGRLLDVLWEGGARKLSILRAFGRRLGVPERHFESLIRSLKEREIVEEYTIPGPTNGDSGPYLKLVHERPLDRKPFDRPKVWPPKGARA